MSPDWLDALTLVFIFLALAGYAFGFMPPSKFLGVCASIAAVLWAAVFFKELWS